MVAWSFYGAPAAIFTASCLLLGIVMLALVRMYPLPEVTVLAVFALGAVDSVAPVAVSERVRSGLHIEKRIISPLAEATATMQGIALTILCAAQLLFSGLVFVIATGLVVRLGSHEVWATLPSFLGNASPLAAAVFLGRLVAAVTLPLAVFAWGFYGILFWIRELQRLPAVVVGPSPADGESNAAPAVARIPGAMLPANGLVLVAVWVFSGVLLPQFEASDRFASTALLWPIVLYLLVALVLFGVCAWTVWRAWQMHPQPVDDEAFVLAVAFLGTQWTVLALNVLLSILTPREALAVGAVFLVAVVVLLGYVRFGLEITDSESVGPISGDALFTVVTIILTVAGAGFLQWYYPAASPWLPGIVLAFAAAVAGLYVLSSR